MSDDFKGTSKKGTADGEIWNPTSKKITGKDGKDYTTRNANPEKGKEPEMRGYYLGFEVPPPKGNQKPSNLHKFQDKDGKIIKVWGSHDIDKQLAEVQRADGLGTFCLIRWNGYLVKGKSKNKPEEILKQGLPEDHYHDWEVIAGNHQDYPPIKVAGAEVYKSAAQNTAKEPIPPTQVATSPVMPETLPELNTDLDASGDELSDDLPY